MDSHLDYNDAAACQPPSLHCATSTRCALCTDAVNCDRLAGRQLNPNSREVAGWRENAP